MSVVWIGMRKGMARWGYPMGGWGRGISVNPDRVATDARQLRSLLSDDQAQRFDAFSTAVIPKQAVNRVRHGDDGHSVAVHGPDNS